jgi:hypothetical protein
MVGPTRKLIACGELDGLIDGDRYFLSERIKTLKAIRDQDQAGAGARTVAAAAEAVCATAGDRKAETARGTLRQMKSKPGPPMTLGHRLVRPAQMQPLGSASPSPSGC